jgi:hypothetical protein
MTSCVEPSINSTGEYLIFPCGTEVFYTLAVEKFVGNHLRKYASKWPDIACSTHDACAKHAILDRLTLWSYIVFHSFKKDS